MQDFHIKHTSTTVINCDNKSALHIAANPIFHEWTNHTEIDYHVVRDKAQARIIHLLPIAPKDQVAYIITKSLHIGPFCNLQNKLGMIGIYSSLRRGVEHKG